MNPFFTFLKKLPFFADSDFTRPEVRRRTLLTVVAVFAILFIVIAVAIRWVSARNAPPQEEPVEQTTNLLEIPEASEPDEILSSGRMSEAWNKRRPGLRDIYDDAVDADREADEAARTDALAAFLGEEAHVEEQPDSTASAPAETLVPSSLMAQQLAGAEKAQKKKDEPQTEKKRPAKNTQDGADAPQRTRRRPAAVAQASDSPEAAERRRREAEAATSEPVITAQTETPPAEEAKGAILVRKSGSISTLDDEWGSIDGLGGLDTDDMYIREDEDRPYRVMFTRDEKVSSGQRITLRTLDDIAVSGMLIPRNTHLSAVISIGERLSISVNSIEIGSKIYQLNLTGYDNDGNVGLYCPSTDSNQTAQQLANAASNAPMSAIGSMLGSVTGGISGTLVGSALGNVASQALTTGATAMTRKGVTSVKINAGYVFFLLKDN